MTFTKKLLNYKTSQVFRGFEQITVGWKVIAFPQIGLLCLLLDFIDKPKTWFLSHNFDTRNAGGTHCDAVYPPSVGHAFSSWLISPAYLSTQQACLQAAQLQQ